MGLWQRFTDAYRAFRDGPPPVAQPREEPRRTSAGHYVGERIAHHWKAGRLKFLPIVDDLNETDAIRRAYRPMLTDPTVLSAICQRIFPVAALDLSVQAVGENPQEQATADWIQYALPRCKGGLRKMVESVLLPGLMEGYSLCGKIKGRLERGQYRGRVFLADLKSYDSNDYTLEIDGHRNVLGVTSKQDQITYPLTDFVYWTHLPLFENPAGMSALRSVYRAYWLLDTAYKLWAIVLERFTIPWLTGKYDDKTNAPELEQALKTAKSLGYVLTPTGCEVEALSMAMNAGKDFEAATKAFREEIYMGLTGAVLNALPSSNGTGTYAMSKEHGSTASLGTWYLADCMASVINDQIVPDLVNDNEATTADYPQCSLGGVDDADLAPALAIDQGLKAMGYQLDLKELEKRYKRKLIEAPQLPSPDLGGGAPEPFPGGFGGGG